MKTEQVIQDAVKYAKESGINHIVIASVTGVSLVNSAVTLTAISFVLLMPMDIKPQASVNSQQNLGQNMKLKALNS